MAVQSCRIKICSENIWKKSKGISASECNFRKVTSSYEQGSNLKTLYSIVNVFLECLENSQISIVDYLSGAAPAQVKMSSKLTIQCNIVEVP